MVRTVDIASRDPRAISAFDEGIQTFRDASLGASSEAFERATRFDPDFAAAHLGALIGRFFPPGPSEYAHFQAAVRNRKAQNEQLRNADCGVRNAK